MSLLNKLLGRKPRQEEANTLYTTLVRQAREPVLFSELAVEDTIDGRFDLIGLHCWMVLFRLKNEGDAARELSQTLFDTMMGNMDVALREMGVGDLSVGKKVKKMASAFLGRAAAYDTAWEEAKINQSDPVRALEAPLAKNLYRGRCDGEKLTAMATYVGTCLDQLAAQNTDDILKGMISFPPAKGGEHYGL